MTESLAGHARLVTLGIPRLIGGSSARLTTRRKELALLTYLGRRSPRSVSREELSALFWGERDSSRARQSLRQALLELRRVLGPGLEVDQDNVTLASGTLAIDASEFEADIARQHYEFAVERWHGDFLEGFEDAGDAPFRVWLESERVRLRSQMARALDALVRDASAHGEWETAEVHAARRTELTPLDEAAHRQLVQVLRAGGKIGDAETRHAAFMSRMREELGVEPSAETARLGRQLAVVASQREPPSRTTALFTPDLVGRERAYAELTAAWQEAVGGGAPVVLIEGEQGIGKTRLCEEFLSSLAARKEVHVVLRARGREMLAAVPLGLASELVSCLSDAPGLAGASPEALGELRRLAPWIEARFTSLPHAIGTAGALHEAVAGVVAAVGEEGPVILFVDDAPDADAASRDLIAALARIAPPHTLLLLTSARFGDDGQDLVRELSAVGALRRLKLPALTSTHVDLMLASMLAMPEAERRVLATRLYAETSGNPLYVTELASALVDEGWLAPDQSGEWRVAREWAGGELPIPSGVRQALLRRLSLLSPLGRELADAAAVFRTPTDASLLGAMTEMSAAAVAAGLDELISRRLLRHSPTSPGALEFAHDLVRRTAAEALDPRARDALHRKAASALAARGAETDPATRAALHYHQERATRHRSWPSRRSIAWVVALMAAIAMLALWRGRTASGNAASGEKVLVLPFRPLVGEATSWSEALPDLLATALDGTPGMQVVDPWAAWRDLRATPSARARSPDPIEAEALARKFGTEWFVTGSLMLEGGRLTASPRLYRVGDGEPRFAFSRETSDDSVMALTNGLAVALIAQGVTASGSSTVGGVEMRATKSPVALKAYLAAKEAMRRGLFDSAEVSIDRAIALDSTFGLALTEATLIKSMTANIRGQAYSLWDIAERAVAHSKLLDERSRMRAQALFASVRTEGRRAADALARLIQMDSADVLAWAALSYNHWAYGWQYGASMGDATAAAEHVVQLDSTYVAGLYARAWLAINTGNRADLLVQRRRLARTDTTTSALQGTLLAVDAVLAPDSAMPALFARLEASPAPIPFGAIRALMRTRPDHAESLLVRLSARWRGDQLASVYVEALARLLLAEGRTTEADSLRARLANGRQTTGSLAIERLLLTARIAGVGSDSVAEAAVAGMTTWVPIDSALALQTQREVWWNGWLLGAYHASRGDTAVARRWAGQLGALSRGSTRFDFAGALRADIEARLELRKGNLAAALAHARRAYDLWVVHTENASEVYPEVSMRYLLARLLRTDGKSDSAEALFRSLAPPTMWVGTYSPLASLEVAELAEERGAFREAADAYRNALRYWSRGGADVASVRGRAMEGLRRVER